MRGGTARLAGGGILAAVLFAVAAGAGALLRVALPETVIHVPVPGDASIAAHHGEGANMPKAYLVAQIRVHYNEGFEGFRKLSGSVIAEHGGRVRVRHPTGDHREGDLRLKFQVQHPRPTGHRMLRWTDEASTSAARIVA